MLLSDVETPSTPARVLVVDDDADIRDLVCKLLERAGLNPSKAGDGEEGLRKFFKLHPDLVVLDIAMPGMNGLKTLERIRDLSDVPVLMLTARDTEPDKVHGLRSGADDYMTKPFGRQELVARVEALLRRPAGPPERPSEVLSDSLVTIDFVQAKATVNGRARSRSPRSSSDCSPRSSATRTRCSTTASSSRWCGECRARRGTRSSSTSATFGASCARARISSRSRPCAASATATAPTPRDIATP